MDYLHLSRQHYFKAVTARAGYQGATILEAKPAHGHTTAGTHGEFHFIVLALTERGEYVTWLYANDGMHHGHYFNDDRAQALADYMERV